MIGRRKRLFFKSIFSDALQKFFTLTELANGPALRLSKLSQLQDPGAKLFLPALQHGSHSVS
jgi:hypothetical protein